MDLDALSRHQLQQLCKEHNIKANLSSKELITLLQTHLSTRTRQSHATERTRASRTPSTNRPLSRPSVPEETPPVPVRTRESTRRSRTTSRSTSTTTAAVAPEPEATTVESEKENKRDPVKRKVRESQKRLGVGKPRAAGGTGPRTVTRIVPSRGSAAGGRTRSRVDPVAEVTRMEVVIEEEPEGQPPSQSKPTFSDSSPTRSSTQPGTSQGDPSVISRKISAIETQISQLCTARDSLLSKLAVQERELVSIRDDMIVDRNKIVEDAMKQVESRLSQQVVEAEAQRSQTLKLFDAERQRVLRLEGQLETLVQRLGTLESRLATSELAGVSATSDSTALDPKVTLPGIDPAAFLDFPTESKDDFAPALLTGNKRAAPPADEERNAATRVSKRARHEPHMYTTAARLEDALTHPISPASAPAASSLPPVPVTETPRTPPMTRHTRRQLALPPGSPGGPPSSQLRFVGAMPPSPTTDSPRKGMKGKGKDTAGGSLLASPAKVKKTSQMSKAPAKDVSVAAASDKVTSPSLPPVSSSLLAGTSASTAPPTLTSDTSAARTRAPSTSPAFPVYEPPSRFTRRGGAGASLGLGRPSAISRPNSTTTAPSPAPPPGGLLPAFSLTGRQSHCTADETDETNTNGTTPGGEILSADEMLAMHQEPVTPMLSAVGMGSMNDSWGGVPNFTSPEDGPPSPDKRTLYGTEVLPSERRGSGRVGGFPPEDDWM